MQQKLRQALLAAVCGPHVGCRISVLLAWVSSQQSAELWGIYMGIKLAFRIVLTGVHIAVDNLAAMWATIQLTGAVGNLFRG